MTALPHTWVLGAQRLWERLGLALLTLSPHRTVSPGSSSAGSSSTTSPLTPRGGEGPACLGAGTGSSHTQLASRPSGSPPGPMWGGRAGPRESPGFSQKEAGTWNSILWAPRPHLHRGPNLGGQSGRWQQTLPEPGCPLPGRLLPFTAPGLISGLAPGLAPWTKFTLAGVRETDSGS